MNNENENTNLCNFEGGDKKRAKLGTVHNFV